uniref:Uncharacterized protein n=1 Tax=Octopus bimaculoides TaxID=37653 RepID=A0A0L8G7L7_OCTBM
MIFDTSVQCFKTVIYLFDLCRNNHHSPGKKSASSRKMNDIRMSLFHYHLPLK